MYNNVKVTLYFLSIHMIAILFHCCCDFSPFLLDNGRLINQSFAPSIYQTIINQSYFSPTLTCTERRMKRQTDPSAAWQTHWGDKEEKISMTRLPATGKTGRQSEGSVVLFFQIFKRLFTLCVVGIEISSLLQNFTNSELMFHLCRLLSFLSVCTLIACRLLFILQVGFLFFLSFLLFVHRLSFSTFLFLLCSSLSCR